MDIKKTFDELYGLQKMYHAALLYEYSCQGKYSVYKSKKNHDGSDCSGGGCFVVAATLPTGQIHSYYSIKDWDLFDIPEYETSLTKLDDLTNLDVLNILKDVY